MTFRTMPLCAGVFLATLLPLTGCNEHDSTASQTPEFESTTAQTPDCCSPADGTLDRTAPPAEEAEIAPPGATPVTDALPPNSAELTAKVGSIQSSVDGSLITTNIGRQPYLDLNFKNEHGQDVNLARDYAGKTIVVATIFTSCPTPTACPRVTDDFADMANRLPAELADKVRFVLVSFDPANDTPEVLNLFGRKHGVDFDRVDLLVSDVPTTKRLMIDELEIPIELDAQTGGFSNHALMVHVINKDGFIVVERTAGSSAKISMLLDEVVRAVNEPFTPPDNGV